MGAHAKHHGRNILTAGLLAFLGCDGSGPVGPAPPHEPAAPTRRAPLVTSAPFTLTPGSSWRYERRTNKGSETVLVEVLLEKRMVMGVEATGVRDRLFRGGELVAETFEWYATSTDGDVRYLGTSEEIDDQQPAGVGGRDGADGIRTGIRSWKSPVALGDDEAPRPGRDENQVWRNVDRVRRRIEMITSRSSCDFG